MEADGKTLVDDSLDDDSEFVPTAEMYIHDDLDDERTINEEELLEDEDQPAEEIDNLMKEKDMPLEQLLALYGYQISQGGSPGEEKAVPSPQEAYATVPASLGGPSMEEWEEGEGHEKGRETTEDKAELQAEGGGVVVGVAGEEVGVADIKEGGWVEVKRNKKDHESHVPRRSMRLFGSSGGIERYLYRESESEDDSDYEPEHWRKEINIGANYQADVPDCTCDAAELDDKEEGDQCLWKPDMLNEKQVRNFLVAVRKGRTSRSSYASNSPLATRDDEQALYVLQRNEYDPSKALRLIQTSDSFVTEAIRPWSEQECIQFEYGLRNHGKNFYAIQREGIPTRSVKEVIQFYYIWKKTERRDLFLQQFRFGKRKAAQMAQLSDYMDRFLDDEDSRSSLSSSLSSWSRDPPPPPPSKEPNRQVLTREKEGLPLVPHPPSSVEVVAPPQLA